jgi:signal transduction histidine kinase
MQLSKSMVKKNTGILTIESEEELGTKIIICFPKN